MAYIQTLAIIQRIEEVINSGAGDMRTIPVGTFVDSWPDGYSEWSSQRKALETPRTRVNVNPTGRSPNSPPINSSLIIYDATITVTCSRLLPRQSQILSDDYDAVQAAGAKDADLVRQALEYPGNLSVCEDGRVTDIVSGMLRWQSSVFDVVGTIDSGAQRLQGTHTFTAQLLARPATSRVVEFTSDGSWTVPSGVTRVELLLWAGGGGGGAASAYGGGGGGGGGYGYTAPTVSPGNVVDIVIGAGGAAGSAGGNTTVTITGLGTGTVVGGAAGSAGSVAGQGAGGAGGTGAETTYAGGAGGGGGGAVTYGGGGGGGGGAGGVGSAGAAVGTRGAGGPGNAVGTYPGGRGGLGAAGTTAAGAGVFPGGGGGGASTGASAGAGAAGYAVILY